MPSFSRRAVLGGAITAPFLNLGGAHAQDKRKVSLTLPWIPDGTNAFVFVAKAKGFWDDLGLDVSISRGFGSLAAAQAVSAGQFQFGLAASSAGIQQSAKGAPLVSIACLGYDALMGICSLRSRGIVTPKNLVGKTLGCTTASGEYPFLPLFAERAGFDLKRVTVNTVDASLRQRILMSGQADAISCFAASAIPGIVTANADPQAFLFSHVGIKLYNAGLLTKPSFTKAEPKLCADVATGLLQGLKFTLLNLDEAVALFAKLVPETTLAAQAAEQLKIGIALNNTTLLEEPALTNGLGYTVDRDYDVMTDLVMKYVGSAGDVRPTTADLFTNDYIGGIRFTPDEWSKAQAVVASYRKYFS